MNVSSLDWWRGAVIYQIYPRSYMDSNGDGIGDIPGIISKLDYIASLNVDAIWLSPFFTSPMKDFGYDVADYRGVDPMFGTLADFKKLVSEAHDRDLKIIIDQVYSHSSDQCDWFKESRQDKTNDKSDWYIWADAKEDGTPPNNWLSLFGGSAWQWDSRRQQYFMHNFLSSQPDLNFHNPEVQDAILDTARFWLDLGVDGFRLDVVNMYFHDAQLRDNPVLSDQSQLFIGIDPSNPFCRQYHINQMCRDDNLGFLQRLRSLMEEYPGSTTIGEIGAPDGMSYMAQYTSGGDKLHMAYTFELLGSDCTPSYLKETISRVESKLNDGWPSFALSNHDVTRSATRWTEGSAFPNEKIRAMLTLLFCLRGSPCLYQGEELGLPEGTVAYKDLQDPFGIEFWPDFTGRDGCRTPMPWTSDKQLGFSSSNAPWLPYQETHKALAVDNQVNNESSMIAYVQQLLQWRQSQPALKQGSFNWIDSDESLLVFQRTLDDESLQVVINFSEADVSFDSSGLGTQIWGEGLTTNQLLPYQCAIFAKKQ